MKEFYVYSSDNDINFENMYAGGGYATQVFWKNCSNSKDKCAVANQLVKQGATMKTPRSPFIGQYYLFNFPKTVNIDTIRKSVLAIPELCQKCQKQR